MMTKVVAPATAGEILVEISDIHLAFDGDQVLTGIDLSVHERELVTLIGPNGAGKTSTIRIILGLMEPDSGKVWRRAGLRVGYVPQTLTVDPVLPLTVRRFLSLGLSVAKGRRREIMEEVGVPHLLDRPIQNVSGGELRRVLLARALLRDPDLLVLDEPVQGVDIAGQAALYKLFSKVRDKYGCGILLISHDLHLVMAETDRVVCINHHVCCAGKPEAVTEHPEYIALFGRRTSEQLAIYSHHHDHSHDAAGHVISSPDATPDAAERK